ncbi:Nicotinate dehydrogenase small FeS subunit [uncultured Eubacteriales bacterium]|uniref:Nicotinate dehydrogenase small FeS subunit n=1 Tax=uncultured Eubacteriales bacterium TaxID=172733 RepID=A0A212KHI7_9FIRM|nr:Nicotinate dehydrogenase small FeS subunit [uncultured Eubacteriales bacterium]
MVEYEGKTVISLNVNGEIHEVAVRPADLLLDVMREQLGLTAAKPGCKNGDCGACTVMMDSWPVKSCLVLAVEAEGHVILTVEGLGGAAEIQRAFVNADAFQCGYCTSGFLMVCHALQTQHPTMPEEYVIEEWLQSNLCRCTSYQEIRRAVRGMYQGGLY